MFFQRRRVLLFTMVFLAILSGVFYYYENIRIPRLERSIDKDIRREIDLNSMEKASVAIVAGNEDIDRYTVITDEIIDRSIKLVEIPKIFKVKGVVTDLTTIKGKITKEQLRIGEQLVIDSFSQEEKWFGEYERLKEFTIKSTVADSLRSGNIVDILVVYGNGDYDVVVPKVKIKKLIVNTDTNDSYIQIVIPVNEIDIRDMIAASQLGEFDVRIYLDESQLTSSKTFNYTKARELLQITDQSKE